MLTWIYRRWSGRSWTILIVGSMLCAGCGLPNRSNAPSMTTSLKVSADLESSQLATNIAIVTLTIQRPNRDPRTDTVTITDGIASATVQVDPGDSLRFEMRAYDANGNVVYAGEAGPINVAGGAVIDLDILLQPTVLMLRPGPLYQVVSTASGSLVEVFVDVHNIDSLFGASFRLFYDTDILTYVGDESGDFLLGGDPSIELLTFALDEGNGFIAYSISRTRQTGGPVTGVSGSGRLATFLFSKERLGTSEISIGKDLELQKPNGGPVAGFNDLYVESATVEVTNQLTASEMLLPLSPGNSWEYERTPMSADVDRHITVSIPGMQTIDGEEFFRLRESGGTESVARQTDKGVITGLYFDGTWFDDQFFLYPVTVDASYQYTSLATGNDEVMVVFPETVKVPAGSFDTIAYQYLDNSQRMRTWWFVPGIGMVKSRTANAEDNASATDWNLLSYNVRQL